jgi:hypothetical protein
MSKLIIGIHGLANKPPRPVLSEYWQASMREGLKKNLDLDASFEFQLVYWSDLLYKHSLHDDELFNFDSLYNDEPYVEAEEGALKEHVEGWQDQLLKYAGQVSGKALDVLRDPLGMERLTDWVLGKVLKDLAFYYDEKRMIGDRATPPNTVMARKVLMDELKRALIDNQGKEIMLIAHSMGTIIAYDVLRRLGQEHPSFEVAEFVTIGSPLGLSYVKAKVFEEATYEQEKRRVRTPTVVRKWVNYADRKDPVAFDSHLSDDYGPNRNGVKVQDDRVYNDYRIKKPSGKSEDNHHKSYGYLRTPELSRHIAKFLNG